MKKLKISAALLTMLATGTASAEGGDRVICLVNTSEHYTWRTTTRNDEDTRNVLALCRSQGGIPYIRRTISY